MNERAELERLRKLKRLRELESKAGGTAQAPATTPEMNAPVQAAAEGFGNTVTMGYLPQIEAGVEKYAVNPLAKLFGLGGTAEDEKLRQQGFNIPEQSYTELRDENIARHQALEKSNPTASMLGKGAGIAATMLVPGGAAAKGAGLVKSALAAGTSGAVQGALYNPGDEKGVVHNPLEGDFQGDARAANAATGFLTGAGGTVAGKALGKVGDVAMQRAVGRKKYTPGVGTTLADEGIIGTKGMMQKQVASKMSSRGDEISDLVDSIPGQIDSDPIAASVRGEAAKFMPRSGAPAAADAQKIGKLGEMADDIQTRGKISPAEALDRRIIAGRRGFRNDDPLESLLGQASKKEQAGYSQALKDGYANANPGAPNKLAQADQSYGALARANRSLNEEETLARSLMGLAAKGGVGAGAGYLVGGPEGAAVGALAGSPIGMSTIGQVSSKSSKASGAITNALAKALMESRRNKKSEVK
jgi:hypothetical protein